tara:strand:- start:1745 stop:2599 length:855 start_codon:yes stop_codon:yes gene_type:complete
MQRLKKLKALDLYKEFPNKILNSKYSDIQKKGFLIKDSHLPKETCKKLLDATKKIYRPTVDKYGVDQLKRIAELGCVRSPFILDKNYRDLLLDPMMHAICNEYFPCGYILHLCRSILLDNNLSKEVSPVEVHRDIPYLYTPSKYPLSLSFLFFFNSSSKPQLLIFKNTHDQSYYDIPTSQVEIHPNQGTLLAFNSNLLHCSLPVKESVSYCLFMFTTPLIKQVVEYSSEKFIKKFNSLNYRVNEILPLLGGRYLSPKDDEQLLERKIIRTSKDKAYYETKPLDK